MSSVREIAKESKVSIATVSRALNNDPEISRQTRLKVLKVANAHGYFAAVGRRVTTNIGLVFTMGEIYWSAYDSGLLTGIMRGVAEQKFDLTLINLQRDKAAGETYTQFFMRKGLRGVILRTSSEYRRVCLEIAEEGFPAIVVAERFEEPNINFVGYDSRDDSRRAVEHLVHLGHRRIAICLPVLRDRDHDDRLEGYREALQNAGLNYDGEFVVPVVMDTGAGVSAINRIMSMPQPPTAVYFTDPPIAIDAMRRVQELGLKVPDDLSIVGFDDTDMRRHVYPVLTAVCQSAVNEGFEAARWLTRRLMGQGPETYQKVFPTVFEINQTTGVVPREPLRVLPDGTRLRWNGEAWTPFTDVSLRTEVPGVQETNVQGSGGMRPAVA